MKTFTICNSKEEILRVGTCSDKDFKLQAQAGEFIIKGLANQQTQKVVKRGWYRLIVDKTPKEIEAKEPKEKPIEKWPAHITNEQWQDVLDRLSKLEAES